ncbi:glycosyl transferase family 1, partial [Burkholderia pseudomallei]
MKRDLAEHPWQRAATLQDVARAARDARRADAPPPAHRARDAARPLRVAIVHVWLVTYAGAERVLEQIVAGFPDADLFGLVEFL